MTELEAFVKHPIQYRNDVPVLNSIEIEYISEQILAHHMPDSLGMQAPVNIEHLVETIFKLKVKVFTLLPDNSILGETIFKDGVREVYRFDEKSGFPKKEHIDVEKGTIMLDSNMIDQMPSRTNFTEAHELGHWILHSLFYGGSDQRACRSFLKQELHFAHRNSLTPIEWTEWQANTFSAAILLPRKSLRKTLKSFLEENSTTWEELKDFSIYDNRIKYDTFLRTTATKYQVSFDTIRLRMNKLCNIRYPY